MGLIARPEGTCPDPHNGLGEVPFSPSLLPNGVTQPKQCDGSRSNRETQKTHVYGSF
jgi:hypothetical protein